MASLVTLNRTKGSIKAQLTRLENTLKDETISWTKIKIDSKLKTLEKISSSLIALRTDYFATLPDDQDITDIESSLMELEERIEDLEVSFNQFLTYDVNKSENKTVSSNISNCKIKLPEIPLPQFSGKYEDWNMFKIEFNNIVTNNEHLSDVQKLHYLHAALKNDAKLLETPDDTFESLFKALENRFENKRIIVNIHLKGILELEKINHESSKELRKLIDAVNKNIRALHNLGFSRNNLSDILFTTIILEKIDKDTRKQFELSLNTSDVPNFDDLMTFLEKRSQSLESINKNITVRSKYSSEMKSKSFLVNSNNSEKNCVICEIPHQLFKCPKFLSMKFNDRFAIVKKNKLCLICFGRNHIASSCLSKQHKCRCGLPHNLLLHRENISNEPQQKQKEIEQTERKSEVAPSTFISKNLSNSFLASNKDVILSTAIIEIKTMKGNFIQGRTLLDSCSQINCVTLDFAKKLGIKKKKVFAPVSGLNGTTTTLNYKIKTMISNKKRNFSKELEFFVVPKITEITPLTHIDVDFADIPSNISLADTTFNVPGKIDLLLGAECFYDLLKSDQIRCSSQNLLFQETVFGYVASGVINNTSSNSQYCGLLTQNDTIEQSLRKFWEVENISDSNSLLSIEEKFCENHFQETHYRNSNGQYVVSMPMEDTSLLGESKKLAEKRLDQLWKRLDRDSNMQLLYSAFIKEYENLNHMELVDESEPIKNCYYIPHQGVYRPEKSTTPLRVVFNASTPTTSGLSLNDILLKGKIPQQELFQIMIRFRKHRYAFTADVEKMYRMILVDPSQRDLLRILWKESIDSPVKIYRLKTVTYGTSTAPFLATRSLKQLALDEQNNLPLASSVVLKDFYVDDVLSGESTLERAKILQSQLTKMLNLGNMKLHKWCANHQDLLISKDRVATEYSFDDQPECAAVKTLGVLWNPQTDCFQFKLEIPNKDSYSKRDVLSLISKIFDPLGLIGPVVTKAKIFMQKLWLCKIDWNEPLPDCITQQWFDFVSNLKELMNINVPRYAFRTDCIVLHGFADASSSAYGAAIYVQSLSVEFPSAHLLCSKSRVAPLKTLTIPRLELCSCLLLAKLMNKVLLSLDVKIEKIVLWTDSTIVLAWLKKSPHELKTFVSNRVLNIQELTENFQWRHISSDNNPADLISRGLSPNQIQNQGLWWHGPPFLSEYAKLPEPSVIPDCFTGESEYNCELKKPIDICLTSTINNSVLDHITSVTNNYIKLIRILGYVIRFIHNSKKRNVRRSGPLNSEEFQIAEFILLRWVQKIEFRLEYNCVKENKPLPGKSVLKSLNPFCDNNDVLRVGGRLQNSNLNFDQKHQIILPPKNKITYLIFEHLHKKNHHIGPQALLYCTRQRFWPVNGRNLARKVTHNCVTCVKNKPLIVDQLMGNPPPERVNVSSLFFNTGVDFSGPYLIKYRNQRKGILHKVYVAIFVCMATKAIHIEMVSDLSSEAFISTLKRFFARRGKCNTLFSDNATNFIGANSELKKLHSLVAHPDEKLGHFLASDGINWNFIPPGSPNFGGLWEAGVKSFKHHFRRAVGNSNFNYEEFLTIITEIEGILNSRPLTPISTDINDLEALTPGHFLIGRPITTIAEPGITQMPENRLSKWKRIEKVTQLIWKRWSLDYLNHFQQRQKWQVLKGNLKPGMMVVLKEENLPKCKWILGRIIDVISGPDGCVRVVNVRTAQGIFKRAVSKIAVLPINTEM